MCVKCWTRAGERRVHGRQSRITCMRMLRMNQSNTIKHYQVPTTLLASVCHAMPFWARAVKKNCFDVNIVVKNIKTEKPKYGYRGLYSYRQRVRVIRLFPNNFYVLFLHVERVCKRFWKENLTLQVAHLHNEARALSSPSRLSTNLGKDFFRFLWYCGKNKLNVV